MPGRSWRAGQPCGDGKPEGPDVPPPLKMGLVGLTSRHQTTGRVRVFAKQIRGGRKGRAERQGLGQSPNEITRLGGLR